MKTLFILLLGVFLSVGFSVSGQTISSVYPDSAGQNDIVNVTITGAGTNFLSATGASRARMLRSGQTINSSSINIISPTQCVAQFTIPPTVNPGNWDIDVPGFAFPALGIFEITGTIPATPYMYVTGKVYADINSNGVFDGPDYPLPLTVVRIRPGRPWVTQSDHNGNYGKWVPLGSYFIEHAPRNNFSMAPNRNITLSVAGDTLFNQDFALTTTFVGDLSVFTSSGIYRPGFTVNLNMEVRNGGSLTQGGVLYHEKAPNLPFSSYSIPPDGFSGDTVFWNIPPIPHNGTFRVLKTDSVPVSLGINATIDYKTWVVAAISDANLNNNLQVGNTNTSGAYDPNDKTAYDESGVELDGFILPGDSIIRYRIRFQNTGNDTAFNIFVRDTIDTKFDLLSVKTLLSSHNYIMTVNDTFVEWYFPNILLEDSFRNEPGSHGLILLELKYDAALPPGTEFLNDVGIYFDYNPPIFTNTTRTVICDTFSTSFATTSTTPLSVNFSSMAPGTTSWWDFGDGDTSVVNNPSHTYATAGTYTVCLVSTNSCGRSRTFCDTISICNNAAIAAFAESSTQLVVNFQDQSTNFATTWMWDFGDGNTSTLQNPTHSYAASGSYTVCLISANSCGSDTICQVVTVTCPMTGAAFNANVSGSTVTFIDQSTGTPTSWFWDFGDGSTSTAQSPIYSYANAGIYTVCLVSSNSCGSDTICNVVMVACTPPTAGFSLVSTQTTADFTDISSGTVSSWIWDFGDGNTSTAQNPTHIYASAGNYTVCLITDGACGGDTICQSVTITCVQPVSAFTYSGAGTSFNFMDGSTQVPTSWLWDFGDGNTSSLQNPSHTYATDGTYTVCLTSGNVCGADSTCNTIIVTGLDDFVSQMDNLRVYPNPVQETLFIDGEISGSGIFSAGLYDLAGKLLLPFEKWEVQGTLHESIDVKGIPAGIYLLEMRMGSEIIRRKVVKN